MSAALLMTHLPCSVELPAGTGKTESIARLVAHQGELSNRTLILTHTHAGVDVIRRRLQRLGVKRNMATVRTLDSWCFDLISSFPKLAGIDVGEEPDWALTREYHKAGRKAIVSDAVIRMLRASYELLVVDEYQDCQVWQHELVVAVADSIPTCVFGDRMQGLFYFGDAEPVDWVSDVETAFPPFELAVHPWRWDGKNESLGTWLLEAREALMDGSQIDLGQAPLTLVPSTARRTVFFDQPRHPATTVAISQWPKSAALLAQQLGGSYTMIEEIEGKHLRAFATLIDTAAPPVVASATVQYAIDCAFGVADAVPLPQRKKLAIGAMLQPGTDDDLNAAVASVNHIFERSNASNVRTALIGLSRLSGFRLFRREAWFGMLDALRLCETTPELNALDAVIATRNKMRSIGRRPESRIVGRPLLIKGLEFDHAVLDSPSQPYNAHELYVCLTRGSQTLTVVADNATLNPARPIRFAR
jgi:hypothetical protein